MEVSRKLIERCCRNDQKAIYELYATCYSIMMSVTTRYIRDISEQPLVVNQSFVKIVKGLKSYDDDKSFGAWAYRVVINTNLDYLRKQSRNKEDSYEDDQLNYQMNGQGKVDFNAADARFDAEDLLAMMDQLPPKTAQVFNLFAIDGYSHEEISKELGISAGTSKWHVSAARERLQKMLLNKETIKVNEQYESR